MKLERKKALASKALGIGKSRIIFNPSRLPEIKSAITKQDIKGLLESGAILIREVKGRAKNVRRSTRRRAGSIKKKFKPGKRQYMILTRKLRSFIQELRKQEKISLEQYKTLRKEIKASAFKTKNSLKERISQWQEQ